MCSRFSRNCLALELSRSIEINAALSNRLHDLHSRRGVRISVLSEEMNVVLYGYQGELGRLLRFAECLDRGDSVETGELVAELGLSSADVWAHQQGAYAWGSKMSLTG